MAGSAVNLTGLFDGITRSFDGFGKNDNISKMMDSLQQKTSNAPEVDLNDPASLMAAAQAAHKAGDVVGAASLVQQARALEAQQKAAMQEKGGQSVAAIRAALEAETDPEKRKQIIASIQDVQNQTGMTENVAQDLREAEKSGAELSRIKQYAVSLGIPAEQMAGLDNKAVAALITEARKAPAQAKPTALDQRQELIKKHSGTPEGRDYLEQVFPDIQTARLAREKSDNERAATEDAAAKAKSEELEKARSGASLITTMLAHPGLEAAVGGTSMFKTIPGSNAADFETYQDQLKGKLFLEAYKQLKGGGTITEVEGAKAEAAMGRLSLSQSEGEYKKSLKELRDIYNASAVRSETGDLSITPPPIGTRDGNGNVYMGGNPKDKGSWRAAS
jgi:hypothetical protein